MTRTLTIRQSGSSGASVFDKNRMAALMPSYAHALTSSSHSDMRATNYYTLLTHILLSTLGVVFYLHY